MTLSWNDIAFQPSEALEVEILNAWDWLFDTKSYSIFLCSMFGDVFLQHTDGSIFWFSAPSAMVRKVAKSRNEFDEICRSAGAEIDEWFMPNIVIELHECNKRPVSGECFCFVILPVFQECRYEPDNFGVVPVREVFVGLSEIQKQLEDVPDGKKVEVRVVD